MSCCWVYGGVLLLSTTRTEHGDEAMGRRDSFYSRQARRKGKAGNDGAREKRRVGGEATCRFNTGDMSLPRWLQRSFGRLLRH